MSYTFTDHLHNYAVWTAARAVQRNFTNTKNIKTAIEASNLKSLIDTNKTFTVKDFDAFHLVAANKIISKFKNLDKGLADKATFGRAAKIIAIYIKTIIVIRDSGLSNLAKIAHPPIDRILLSNAHKVYPNFGLDKINWTQLNESKYFELIDKLRTINLDYFWKFEQYWSPL